MMTTSNALATELVKVVTGISGVRGLEPGITSALRVWGARVSGENDGATRYGIILDDDSKTVTIEVGIDDSRPVKEIVSDIQNATREVFQRSTDVVTATLEDFVVTVKVKSLSS